MNPIELMLPPHRSKHYRKGDSKTGPGAAEIYRSKHHRGGLRQFIRAARIEAGERPLRYDTEWQRGDQ